MWVIFYPKYMQIMVLQKIYIKSVEFKHSTPINIPLPSVIYSS